MLTTEGISFSARSAKELGTVLLCTNEIGKFNKIIIVINKKHLKFIKRLKLKNIKIAIGGKTRAESAYKALKSIQKNSISKVFIHDAARPNFSLNLIFGIDFIHISRIIQFKYQMIWKCVC